MPAPPTARCPAPDSHRFAPEVESAHRSVPDWSGSYQAHFLSCLVAYCSVPEEQPGPRLSVRSFAPRLAQNSAARSEARVSVIEAYQLSVYRNLPATAACITFANRVPLRGILEPPLLSSVSHQGAASDGVTLCHLLRVRMTIRRPRCKRLLTFESIRWN
jgi:hypothetical protein